MNIASVESVCDMVVIDEALTIEQAEVIEFLTSTHQHFGALRTTLIEILTTILQLLEVLANWEIG